MTELERHLDRIATALERAFPPEPTELPAPTGCQHPIERRIDFGWTNGLEDWQCGVCGYRTLPQSEELEIARG